MLPRDNPFLEKIVRVLCEYGPDRIILFGSHARGSADAHSDYDIALIKRTDKPFLDRLLEMAPYRTRLGRAVDILVYTPEEFEQLYLPARYPNGLPAPAVPADAYSAPQSQSALEAVEQILQVAREQLQARSIPVDPT